MSVSNVRIAADIFSGIIQCYNSYKTGVIVNPKLEIEVRHVDWRDRLYDGLIKTVSGIWDSTKTGFTAGLITGAVGIAAAGGVVALDWQIGKILPIPVAQRLLNDPMAGLQLIGMVSAAVGSIFAMYKGGELIVDAIQRRRPSIEKPIFHEELNSDIVDLIAATYNLQQHGGFFQNLLLYGPSGTGKTMLSKWIAENSKMNYVMMSGGDLVQYANSGRHVTELNRLFENAKKSRSPTILFIDEAESLCCSRDKIKRSGLIELLDAFLKQIGEPSKKVMVILATNRLEDFDSAVLSRVDHKMFIGLPEAQERKKIIKEYIPRFFTKKEQHELFNDHRIAENVRKTEGLSGRSLFKMLNHLAGVKMGSAKALSCEMIDSALNRFIARDRQVETLRSKPVEQAR